MKETKLMVGVTADDEIYFLTFDRESGKPPHFSMCGETVAPMKRTDAVDQVREQLEDGGGWKHSVMADMTTLGKDHWIDHVLAINGDLAGFDNSLFPAKVEVDGIEYIFDSRSCGQHEEHNIKHFFIDEKLFKESMKLWKRYHLKELPKNSVAEHIYTWAVKEAKKQDHEALAVRAVQLINGEE